MMVSSIVGNSTERNLTRVSMAIFPGKLSSMRHLKNEVDTIKKDVECGLMFDDEDVIPEPGDTVVCYTTKMEKQEIDWNPGF